MQKFLTGLFLVIVIIVGGGCYKSGESLEVEIENLPREWSQSWRTGASSNNWALLNRVVETDDVTNRIRLVIALRNKMLDQPDELFTNWKIHDRRSQNRLAQQLAFSGACADKLITDMKKNPLVTMSGWKLESEWTDYLERLIVLTEKDWNNGVLDCRIREKAERRALEWRKTQVGESGTVSLLSSVETFVPQEIRIKREIARIVRREYENYFKYTFNPLKTYNDLPDELRPAFVKQIKKDFFKRKGMAYVKMEDLPPAFREP